jgi:hypothetical protein
MEPWQLYLQQLRQRVGRMPEGAFGRAEIMAEAAHDAYQHTTNQLTEQGWGEEHALTVTRMFGQAVKEWIARGDERWESLESELTRRYEDWTRHRKGI